MKIALDNKGEENGEELQEFCCPVLGSQVTKNGQKLNTSNKEYCRKDVHKSLILLVIIPKHFVISTN